MKTTFNDLKLAYKSHIQRYIPTSREGCPSEEDILQIFENSTPPQKKEEVIDHVVKCAYCLREFELFLTLVRDENKAVKEISEFLRKKSRDFNPPRKKPKFWGIISGLSAKLRPLWKLAAISITFLIITGLFMISIRTILKPTLNEERGRLGNQIRLVSPIQGQVVTLPLTFRWQKVPQAQIYQLEIFDETLLPLWKSPQIFGLIYKLPPEIEGKIQENKIYFWMTTAFLPGGTRKESPLESFILKR
ncbi:MAG: hypothetical protein WBC70_15670 [Candidatus Aminicenantales bacterium]